MSEINPVHAMARYKHTQIGYVTTVGLVLGAVITFFSYRAEFGGDVGWMGATLTTAFCVGAVLFSSMTIAVDADSLRFYFGPGFWEKEIPLEEIRRVKPVRTSVLSGWGIRYTSNGWLYNVSGFQAVEIQRRNGGTIRVGTDEPEKLKEAVETRFELA